MPRHIRPVFRDKTDLGAGVLSESLRRELELSKYLIVVCSPAAARSEWVNREIGSFIEMGRADSIIPFVVGGVPHSLDAATECLPPVLRGPERELLGISVSEIGRERAFIKVVARILELRFDVLWNRHRRLLVRRRLWAAGALAVLLCVLGYVWDYNRLKCEYYVDYVDRWGIPAGVVPLTRSQVAKRFAHYRFEYRQRQLRRVVCANSAGIPTEYQFTEFIHRPVIQEVEYERSTGQVIKVIQEDAFGIPQKVLLYPNVGREKNVVDVVTPAGNASSTASSVSSLESSFFALPYNSPKSHIGRYEYQRNEKGEVVRLLFRQNNDNVPVCDANGIYGFGYVLDSLGRPVRIDFLDAGANIVEDQTGIAGKRYVYDGSGNIGRVVYVDGRGQPAFNAQKWAILENESNADGNMVSASVFDPEGKPCLNYVFLMYRLLNRYDEQGFSTETTFAGVDGKPMICGLGYAKLATVYEQGRPVKQSYLGINGEPVYAKNGISVITRKYDAAGRTAEESYWGTDGHPCRLKTGFARIEFFYSDRGEKIREAYFDEENNACFRFGVASLNQSFTDGNVTEVAYFDEEGRPGVELEKGVYCIRMVYDGKGNLCEEAYFDTAGNRCFSKQGIHAVKSGRDLNGNITEESYFDTHGNPVASTQGIAAVRRSYRNGRLVSESYFDTEGSPGLRNDLNINRREIGYDRFGNPVRYSCYGLDEQGGAVLSFVIEKGYDRLGRETVVRYLNASGQLVAMDEGFAEMRYEWDEMCRQTKASFFDVSGRPVLSTSGFAGWRARYDASGHRVFLEYFDTQGGPTENNSGVAIYRTEYDERGNLVAEQTENRNGELCCSNGYARLERVYDTRTNLVQERLLDESGRMALHKTGGYARLTRQYDRQSRCVEERYFDQTDQPCNSSICVACCKMSYDLFGNLASLAYFDAADRACPGPGGFARVEQGWNRQGVCIDKIGYDTTGRLQVATLPFLVVQKGGKAYVQGMRKSYGLFRFCDWTMADRSSRLDDSLSAYVYRDPKMVVVMNGDLQVEQRRFGLGRIGVEVVYQQVDSAVYQEFARRYSDWKAQQGK